MTIDVRSGQETDPILQETVQHVTGLIMKDMAYMDFNTTETAQERDEHWEKIAAQSPFQEPILRLSNALYNAIDFMKAYNRKATTESIIDEEFQRIEDRTAAFTLSCILWEQWVPSSMDVAFIQGKKIESLLDPIVQGLGMSGMDDPRLSDVRTGQVVEAALLGRIQIPPAN